MEDKIWFRWENNRLGYPERGLWGGLHHRAPAVMMLSATAAWGGAKGRSSQGAERQPVASRSPPCKETHLLRMSMLPLNPSKGFPGSTPVSAGRASLMSWSCVFSRHWSHYPCGLVMSCFWSERFVWSRMENRECHCQMRVGALEKKRRAMLLGAVGGSTRSHLWATQWTIISHTLYEILQFYVWRSCGTVVWQ